MRHPLILFGGNTMGTKGNTKDSYFISRLYHRKYAVYSRKHWYRPKIGRNFSIFEGIIFIIQTKMFVSTVKLKN